MRFCFMCGGYCTHYHHLVKPKPKTRAHRNVINICFVCHQKLHKGLCYILASALPREQLLFVFSHKEQVVDDCIYFNKNCSEWEGVNNDQRI